MELLRSQQTGGSSAIPGPRDVSNPRQYQGESHGPGHVEARHGGLPNSAQGASSHRQYQRRSSTVYSPYPSAPQDAREHSVRIPDINQHGRPSTATDTPPMERQDHEIQSRGRHADSGRPPVSNHASLSHPESPRPNAPTYTKSLPLPPPSAAAATPSRPLGIEENLDESAADMLLSIGRSGSIGGSNGFVSNADNPPKRHLPGTVDMEDSKRLKVLTPMKQPLSSPPPPMRANDNDDRAPRAPSSPKTPSNFPSSAIAGSAKSVD